MQTEDRSTTAPASFVPALLRMGLPIALQAFMMTALNLADTFMVGQIGEVQIAAIALGNQVFFLLILFLFGVGSGSAVFGAQYWGDRNIAGVRRSLGLALVFALVGAGLFSFATIAAPRAVLSVFTEDLAVIAEGERYLRIVGISYVFTAISTSYTFALRSIGSTRLPMWASAISIVLNIVGNYVLIFGAFGLPAMGVAGAALATVIARLIETAMIVVVVYRNGGPTAASVRDLSDWNRPFVGGFMRKAVPVVLNEIIWSTGFTMYTVVFGRIGTDLLAAYTIAGTIGRLMMVVFVASGQASAVLIGNEIGAGRPDGAQRLSQTLVRGVPIVAAIMTLVGFFGLAIIVPNLFQISAEVQVLVRRFIRLFSVLMLLKTLNLHIIIGILRGGGDTTYGLIVDILPLWVIGVPAAFITGLILRFPPEIVYLSLAAEEIVRFVFAIRRVRSGRWIHDLTGHERDTLPGLEAAGAPPLTPESSPDALDTR